MEQIKQYTAWCQERNLKSNRYESLKKYLDQLYVVEAYYLSEEMHSGSVTYHKTFNDLDEYCENQLLDEPFENGYLNGNYDWTKSRLYFDNQDDFENDLLPLKIEPIEHGENVITFKEMTDAESNYFGVERMEV